MAVSVDLAKSLDKAYEGKALKEILDASPAALAGVTDRDAELLAEAFNIETSGNWVRISSSPWLLDWSRWRTPASPADQKASSRRSITARSTVPTIFRSAVSLGNTFFS